MKKILSILVVLTMVLSALVLSGCGAKAEEVKLGLGVSASVSATDATADKDGQGQATFTVAAVLVDGEGKVVKAVIDCADNKVGFTAEGKAVSNDTFTTKYEAGTNYNMVAYGGAKLEWFEQADVFCNVIVGKTASEIKALVAADAKGTEEVLNAGCTIYVSDFVKAVEKAIANATVAGATAEDTLKLGVATAQTIADATEDKNGSNKVATNFFAAAVDAEGKVVAASTDCAEVTFTFDVKGVSTFDASQEVLTKKEKGTNYNMVAYGGAKLEWFEQVAIFDAACVGKTVAEIEGMMLDTNYGGEELQTAGCTILVDGFMKAVSKIG